MSERDERKIKGLIDRLMAMSPEPPPFPEEVTVTQTSSPKRNPVLVFAGAAVVVLILAAIPLLLFNGGGDGVVAETTTTTQPVTTTVPGSTTTQPGTSTTESTSTTVAVDLEEVVIFLAQSPEGSVTGNPSIVPFRTLSPTVFDTSAGNAIDQLLANPALIIPDGFENMVPSGIEVQSVAFDDTTGVYTVDMNDAFAEGSGSGLLGDQTMLNQLIYTVTGARSEQSVLFTVNGSPIHAFGTEGLDISEPLTVESFLDEMNPIIVTNPVDGSDGLPLVVSGAANVFEATVSLEVLDADGVVVHEDHTTATCGTGCWGGYSFEIIYPFTGTETVRVFEVSAKDGSPTNVVTIPILWNDEDGWTMLP